jgi:hypothetical protein
MNPDTVIGKINDDRIANYTKRSRSGRTQEFYTGTDARDFSRQHADRKAGVVNPKMHLCADTIHIQPPERHIYSELINGEWYWLNGCAECNGNPRDWMTYIECEEHDVCSICQIHRTKLEDIPWGGKHGWKCKPCQQRLDDTAKWEALNKVAETDYEEDDYLYNSNVICPHCATDQGHESCDGEPSEKSTCDTCGGEFSVEVNYAVDYSTQVIGERVVNDEE